LVAPRSTSCLYRPVGLKELELVLSVEARGFPPRLPSQPIFYPVVDEGYAVQIARDWNPSDEASGYAGFVTEFDVEAGFIGRFPVQRVGASNHRELWIAAEQLREFNEHLQSSIRVTQAFFGPNYVGPTPVPVMLKGVPLHHQLKHLHRIGEFSGMDFTCEVGANWKLVLCNFGWWSSAPPERQGLSSEQAAKTLQAIRAVWDKRAVNFPLPRFAGLMPA
jgi:hypothetical protein